MKGFLPMAFIVLSGGALLFAVSFLWASLRGLFGGNDEVLVQESQAMRKRHELLDEKDAVLKSLKDLEFERDVGKLSDEDFMRLERELRGRARQILRQLDDEVREHRAKAKQLIETELKHELKLEQQG
ncbi:MAG: hypothetical protein ABW252_25275 [Polyangiales bacterium]